MTVIAEKPATAEELSARLRQAAESGLSVTPVGGGRASGMGGLLERCDIELHTTRLDRVVEHSRADMVVSVEAGITLEALQVELAKAGQFLPLDPFNSPGHTIGGLLANGWTGPLRQRYGTAREYLIGIRVALPDGRLASAGGRVVKNVSGYDLMKLHIGALGSLGVIVAASFKVFPKPLHAVTVEIHADNAWAEAERALRLSHQPAALELFSSGRLLAEFMGSRGAVERMVTELGWTRTDPGAWDEHGMAAPVTWARIAAPRKRLRDVLQQLPDGAQWWASPGVGVAHWSIDFETEAVGSVRKAAEAAGGSLVLLAAPDDLKRQIGAWGTPPPTLDVMRRIKAAFDPGRVLNPGRYLV